MIKSYRIIQEDLQDWRVIFFEDGVKVSTSLFASEEEALMAGGYFLQDYSGCLPYGEEW